MVFLESPRFPTDLNYGVVGGPVYKTHIIEKNSGWENANSVWPQGRYEYDLVYEAKDQQTIEHMMAFFHAMKGRAHGFRFKDFADYKSCSVDNSISFTDQLVSGALDESRLRYQLIKTYTQGNFSTVRVIKKPVVGTVTVAVSGFLVSFFTVDYSNGVITFSADKTDVITHVASKNPCVITAKNNFVKGDTVYITEVDQLSELNDRRYKILSATSTQFTIDVDMHLLPPYIKGGIYHTSPQPKEVITAGFEFDVPVRFANDTLHISMDSHKTRSVHNLGLIEVRV